MGRMVHSTNQWIIAAFGPLSMCGFWQPSTSAKAAPSVESYKSVAFAKRCKLIGEKAGVTTWSKSKRILQHSLKRNCSYRHPYRMPGGTPGTRAPGASPGPAGPRVLLATPQPKPLAPSSFPIFSFRFLTHLPNPSTGPAPARHHCPWAPSSA